MSNLPLLITSAAFPAAPFVTIVDSKLRIKYSIDAIRQWRRIDPNIEIVICDGSGYDFSSEIAANYSLADNNIEILHFKNNADLVRSNGKGYGEGEIVSYALHHSKVLKNNYCFAKCTSKLWVENFEECSANFNGVLNIERMYTSAFSKSYNECDTRFYIVNKSVYFRTLIDCHKNVNDHDGRYLEHTFADAIKSSKMRRIDFISRPLIYGYSGSSGDFLNSKPDLIKTRILRQARRLLL